MYKIEPPLTHWSDEVREGQRGRTATNLFRYYKVRKGQCVSYDDRDDQEKKIGGKVMILVVL